MQSAAHTRSRRFAIAGTALALLLASCGDDRDQITGSPSLQAPVPVKVAQAGDQSRSAGAPEVADEAGGSVAPGEDRMAYWSNVEYVLQGDLPAMPGEANGWQYVAGSTPNADQVQRIADALGVQGELVEQPADQGGGWAIGPNDGSAPALFVTRDGQLSWYFSAPYDSSGRGVTACAEPGAVGEGDVISEDCDVVEPTPPAGVPTADEAKAKANALLEALGLDPAAFELEVYADEWYASVTAFSTLGGIRSPVSWYFGFGAEGALQSAGGSLAQPVEVGPYPLISIEAALDRLRNGYGGGFYGGPAIDIATGEETVAGDVAGDAVTDQAVDPAAPVDPMPPVDAPQETITITLVDVKAGLWWAWDVDGTVWLLPAYSFIDADGNPYIVPAVTDEYLVIEEPVVEPLPEPVPTDTVVTDPGSGTGSDGSTGSGDTPTTLVVDPDTTITEPTAIPQETADQLIGLTEEEANKVADGNGWTVRVSERDGEKSLLTADYSYTRVNLKIEDGTVIGVTVG